MYTVAKKSTLKSSRYILELKHAVNIHTHSKFSSLSCRCLGFLMLSRSMGNGTGQHRLGRGRLYRDSFLFAFLFLSTVPRTETWKKMTESRQRLAKLEHKTSRSSFYCRFAEPRSARKSHIFSKFNISYVSKWEKLLNKNISQRQLN